MSRSCARPGCGGTAAATLSYAYAERVVWLDDLAAEGHPMVHDLCPLHAASVRVPRGWTLADRRRPDRLPVEGAGGLRLVGA